MRWTPIGAADHDVGQCPYVRTEFDFRQIESVEKETIKMNILKIYRMLKKSAGLAILLLGYMFPGVVAAESVHGRVTFVGTIGEFREPTGVFHAQFRFRVSESTCSNSITITIPGVLLAGKFRT